MKLAEKYYKKIHWFPGLKMEDKYDKHAEVFDYYDLMDFATQFSESKNKELVDELNLLTESVKTLVQCYDPIPNREVNEVYKRLLIILKTIKK